MENFLQVPDLWKTISRLLLIGFMRSGPCWKALVLGYMLEKRVVDLGHWLRSYCVPEMGIYNSLLYAHAFLYLITLFMQQLVKSPTGFPRVCPFSCNHILGELLCSWVDSLHTPPTLDMLFFVYCLYNL
jgi:hypothetical protein